MPFTDLEQDFNSAPVADPYSCSTPLGALVSSDGASEGASSLKLDPGVQDSWLTLVQPWVAGAFARLADTTQVWVSFALYLPDWNDFWDGGNAWFPNVLAFDYFTGGSTPGAPNPNLDLYLIPTSSTTGDLWFYDNGHGSFNGLTSIPITPATWLAIEFSYLAKDAANSNHETVEFWLNNVDQGVFNGASLGTRVRGFGFGDKSWDVGHGLPFYVDNFRASLNGRIGPADLSAAFFHGVASGTDYDACTGDPVSAHPVDDSYTVDSPHTLNVAAPGVMSNDIVPTTVSLNTGPAHGSLILNSDGSFSYTPDTTFLGDDTWTYNGNGGTATVTITVAQAAARGLFDGGPVHQAAG